MEKCTVNRNKNDVCFWLKKVTIKDTTLLITKNFSNLGNIIPREHKEWFEQVGQRVKPLTLEPLLLLDDFLVTWYSKRVKELQDEQKLVLCLLWPCMDQS